MNPEPGAPIPSEPRAAHPASAPLERLRAEPTEEALAACLAERAERDGLDRLDEPGAADLAKARVVLGLDARAALEALASEAERGNRLWAARAYRDAARGLSETPARAPKAGSSEPQEPGSLAARSEFLHEAAARDREARSAELALTLVLPPSDAAELSARLRSALTATAALEGGLELVIATDEASFEAALGTVPEARSCARRIQALPGVTGAIRAGLEASRARLIGFLPTGSRLGAGYARLVRAALASGAALCYGDADHDSLKPRPGGGAGRAWLRERLGLAEHDVRAYRFDPWLAPGSLLLRRELASRLGPLDVELGLAGFTLLVAEAAAEAAPRAPARHYRGVVVTTGGPVASAEPEPALARRFAAEVVRSALRSRGAEARARAERARLRGDPRLALAEHRRGGAWGNDTNQSLRERYRLAVEAREHAAARDLAAYLFAQGQAPFALAVLREPEQDSGVRGRKGFAHGVREAWFRTRLLAALAIPLVHAFLVRRPWRALHDVSLWRDALPLLDERDVEWLVRSDVPALLAALPRGLVGLVSAIRAASRGFLEGGLAEARARLGYRLLAGASPAPTRLICRDRPLGWLARRTLRARLATASTPSIGLAVAVLETQTAWLEPLLASLARQVKPCASLALAAEPGARAALEAALRAYPQVRGARIIEVPPGSSLELASARALAAAEGDFVGLLGASDLLFPDALAELGAALAEPDVDLAYSDEDRLGVDGRAELPLLKPGWSPRLLEGLAYLGRLTLVRQSLVAEVGGIDPQAGAAFEHDLLLRVSERVRGVRHVPRVLYRRRTTGTFAVAGHAAWNAETGPVSATSLARHARRLGLEARPEPGHAPRTLRLGLVGVERPLVSVLLPTRGTRPLLERALEGLRSATDYARLEVVLVDHSFGELETRRALAGLTHRVLRWRAPFNHSRMNNAAAAEARGELLLLLNDDVEPLEPGWLAALVEELSRPQVGLVGAKLLYPDGLVQHAGILLADRPEAFARHAFRFWDDASHGYLGLLDCAREVSAVTAACALVRRDVYSAVGGLDESIVDFNDVDLCLRIRARGLRIVYTPWARLLHHEAASRQSSREGFLHEAEVVRRRWLAELRGDPYYHPDLGFRDRTYELREGYRIERQLESRCRR